LHKEGKKAIVFIPAMNQHENQDCNFLSQLAASKRLTYFPKKEEAILKEVVTKILHFSPNPKNVIRQALLTPS
jgi:hypothetical protein